MIYGSVCSGIEAATVAWGPLGWKAAWFSEIEKFPCAVLEHHYPDVPNLGDMTRIHDHEKFKRTNIDILVGGTPCQSFSVAGLRKGMEDPRGNLALVYLSIADRTRPPWLVWENVPGVLSSNEGRDFGAFLGALAELGYGWAYRVLDAQYFGVPQRRRRVFVVGYLGDWRRAASVLFERESLSGYSPPRREEGERVAPCLSQSLKGSGGIGMSDQELFSQGGGGLHWSCYENHPNDSRITDHGDMSPALTQRGGTGGGNLPLVMAHGQGGAEICRDGSPSLTCNHEAPILARPLRAQAQHSHREDSDNLITVAIRTAQTSANGCGVSEDVAHTLDGVKGQAVAFSASQDPDVSVEVAHPLLAQHNGRSNGVAQNMTVRRLTPRECERLQGFPDGYTRIPWRVWQECQRKGWSYEAELMKRGLRLREPTTEDCPDGPRYKALGNSMAVPVMRWIGERIQKVEDGP